MGKVTRIVLLLTLLVNLLSFLPVLAGTVPEPYTAHYPFQDGPGSTVLSDVSGASLHAELAYYDYYSVDDAWHFDTPYSEDYPYSVYFPGRDTGSNRESVEFHPLLTDNLNQDDEGILPPKFTVSLWFKTGEDITGTYRMTIINFGSFDLRLNDDGQLLVRQGSYTRFQSVEGVSYDDLEWHNLIFLQDETEFSVYVDGVDLTGTPVAWTLPALEGQIKLAYNNLLAQHDFKGWMTGVTFYNRILNSQEIGEIADVNACSYFLGEVLGSYTLNADDYDGVLVDVTGSASIAIALSGGPWYDGGTPKAEVSIGYRYQDLPTDPWDVNFEELRSRSSCNQGNIRFFRSPTDTVRLRVNDGLNETTFEETTPWYVTDSAYFSNNTGSIIVTVYAASGYNSCDSVYELDTLLTSQLIDATAQNGIAVDLTPGAVYMIETYGGPWDDGNLLSGDRYDLAVSPDNLTWFELADFFWFECQGSTPYPYYRYYFTAQGTGLNIRVNDTAGWFGDNGDTMGVRIYTASGESCEANFTQGDLIYAATINATDSDGESWALPIGNYSIEIGGGPWNTNRYDTQARYGGQSWYEFDTDSPGWMLCRVPVGSNYYRGYFSMSQASTISSRANDTVFGDNTGTYTVNIRSTTRENVVPISAIGDGNMEVYPPALSPWGVYQDSQFIRLYSGYNSLWHGTASCGVGFQQVFGDDISIGGGEPALGVTQDFDWVGGRFYWRADVSANRGIFWFLGQSYVSAYVISGGNTYWLLQNHAVGSSWETVSGNIYLPPGNYQLVFAPGQSADNDDRIYVDDIAVDQVVPRSACDVGDEPATTATPTGTIPPVGTLTPTPTSTSTPAPTPLVWSCGMESNDGWTLNAQSYWDLSGGPVLPTNLVVSGNAPGAYRTFSWSTAQMAFINFWAKGQWQAQYRNVNTGGLVEIGSGNDANWTLYQLYNYLGAGTYRIELNSSSSGVFGYYDGVQLSANYWVNDACSYTPTPGPTAYLTATPTPTGPTPTRTSTPVWNPTATRTPTAVFTNTPWPSPTARFDTPTPTPIVTGTPPTPTASPTGQIQVVVTLQFPDVGTPEYQPPPAWDANCLRPEETWQIAGWVEYNRCRTLSWFSWGPPQSATVQAVSTQLFARDPFGSISDLYSMSTQMAQAAATYDWGGLGDLVGTPAPLDIDQFLPDENSPWNGGQIDFNPADNSDDGVAVDACMVEVQPILGEFLAQGLCWFVYLLNKSGMVPWIQLLLNFGSLTLLLVYLTRKIVDAGTTGA